MKTLIVFIVIAFLLVGCQAPEQGSPEYQMERQWYSSNKDEHQSLEKILGLEDCVYISMSRDKYPHNLYVVRCPKDMTVTETVTRENKRDVVRSTTLLPE